MEKPTPEVIALFDRLLPQEDPRVQRRPMFGMPTAFVDGHMFMGVYEDRLIIRLGEADRAALAAEGGEPFAPGGRTMREYLGVPPSGQGDEGVLADWVARSLAFAGALPPKPPKKKRSRKGAGPSA